MAQNANHRNITQLIQKTLVEPCEEFEEFIYPYAVMQLRGETPSKVYDALRKHISGCKDCAELYQATVNLLEMEKAGIWIEPAEIPVLPLPWQNKPVDNDEIESEFRLMVIDNLKIWFADKKDAVQQLMLDLGEMAQLSPQLQMRSRSEVSITEDTVQDLLIDLSKVETLQNGNIRISIVKDQIQQEKNRLWVEINLPKRWPDFSGILVMLIKPNGEEISIETDQRGLVEFTNLNLDEIIHSKLKINLPRE